MSSNIEGIINQKFVDEQVARTAIQGSANSGFDGDMFMNLLLTQLRNQDPFNTVETEQIMQQQAILTEVEQSIKQTNSMQELQASVDIGLADMSRTLNTINQTLQTLVEGLGNGDSNNNQGA